MATIRITAQLRGDIIQKAIRLTCPAVEKATRQKPDNKWGEYIYDTLFGEHKDIASQLPDGWTRNTYKIKVKSVGDLGCDLDFFLSKPKPWPWDNPYPELAVISIYWNEAVLVLKNNIVWGEFYAEVKKYLDKIRFATEKRQYFVDGVERILAETSSLKRALEIWPPLWELVPDWVKAKYGPLDITQATKPFDKVDRDRLTAILTAAKLWV